MIFKAKVGVFFERRMFQIERYFGEPLPIAWQQMKPPIDVLNKIIEGNASFKDQERSDVEWIVGGLAIEEGRVESCEPPRQLRRSVIGSHFSGPPWLTDGKVPTVRKGATFAGIASMARARK